MTPEPLLVSDYLGHILGAIQRISKYTANISEEDFRSNELVQDAVIRNIEVMGEAARNAQSCGKEIPEIRDGNRLSKVYRMRNKLAHGYFSVDLSVIWRTLQDDIPVLQQEIQEVFNRLTK
ncbi:MAG TPA: DUF86 domain-containing protein [Silvibacterium sp.]|nr:DUF86 domain-containing protein [Silvibacterium sp.]